PGAGDALPSLLRERARTEPRESGAGRADGWMAGLGTEPERPGGGRSPPCGAASPTGRRVAMVGAGSGSLMCAWLLRQLGHTVDIFDREALPGGLLQTGYPSFRMNKAVVQAENDHTE